ncbi:MAG: hypothetical protein LAT51_10140 [Flavobacteriaceae bacterium]|nr:hypothetical protein [Flavobacteriaceae bacterium]
MLEIIIYIVVGILIVFGLVKVIDSYLPKKLRPVLSIVLIAGIGILAYMNYKAIYGPVEFNKVKEKRYAEVIDKLRDVRKVQIAHREINRSYAKNFDQLLRFLDTAEYVITQRRDTTYIDEEYLATYGVDKYIEDYVVDTLGYKLVKDSLFGNSNRYKTMMEVPYTDGKHMKMQAGLLDIKGVNTPVFKVEVPKEWILADQDKDLLNQELQVKSVDGINGESILVGSMEEVSTNGNWPTTYGKQD